MLLRLIETLVLPQFIDVPQLNNSTQFATPQKNCSIFFLSEYATRAADDTELPALTRYVKNYQGAAFNTDNFINFKQVTFAGFMIDVLVY
ncbi:hypothetical protein LC608_36635 [Nostoc sp. XA010]|uniref:hypothetical protein n=1 Tax=Nostoc sp. XA010 TaxID=2780407 RepID=UPI001E51A86F|nr:hypothetical protein [Nostoc sp. XA010]MCC5662332.1 hypothetical protein [Nostoc sp. XA010]